MSEDEHRRGANEEQPDDVEAHKRHTATANVEPAPDEPQSEDDDFEAHRRHTGV
jgi:hypothetical protein